MDLLTDYKMHLDIAEQWLEVEIETGTEIEIAKQKMWVFALKTFIKDLGREGQKVENPAEALHKHDVSNLVCDCTGCTALYQINSKFICGTCNRPLAQTCY